VRVGKVCVSSNCTDCSNSVDRLAECLRTRDIYVTDFNPTSEIGKTRYSTFERFPQCRATALNQGCCGSCVAFSVGVEMAVNQCVRDSIKGYGKTSVEWRRTVADAIIGHHNNYGMIRGTHFARLSEQYLLSCSLQMLKQVAASGGQDWWDTCSGFDQSREHSIISKYGMPAYDDQRYVEGDMYWMTFECSSDGNSVATMCSHNYTLAVGKGCNPVVLRTLEDVKTHIATHGSAVATIDPSNVFNDGMSYGYYTNTVATGTAGGGHSVLVYGWGKQGDTDYLLLHNSWGLSWGNEGTVYVDFNSFLAFYGCGLDENYDP